MWVIFNALLYFITLVIYIYKKREFDTGICLLSIYFFIALMGCVLFFKNPDHWDVGPLRFIYLYIICMLFFRPFLRNNLTWSGRKSSKMGFFYILAAIYIIASIIVLYYTFKQGISNIFLQNLGDVYMDKSSGDLQLYVNQFDRLSKIFCQYFKLVAYIIVVPLWNNSDRSINKWIAIILLVVIIGSSVISSFVTAARGTLLKDIVIYPVIVFSFFKNTLSDKTRKFIIRFFSLIVIGYLFFSIVVANMRFEGRYEISDTIVSYLGQPMLNFNDGLMNYIQRFYHGDLLFGSNDITGVGIDYDLGTNIGTGFFTFVGSLYLDFGPIGTLLIALFFPLLFNYKTITKYSSAFIYTFYASFLTMGVFVYGIGYYIIWVMSLAIYLLLKLAKI